VDLSRPEGDVDEGEALEDLVLDRLRPATADADDSLGLFGLEPLRLTQMSDEAAVRRLANRAGVEQNQIGRVATLSFVIPKRRQHPPHPLRIVHVHLTAERSYVKALRHQRQTSAEQGSRVGLAKPPRSSRR
jgi:hypothetical protein